jgi:hypothetical protein
MLKIPHCLDNRLTVNCEILATCSSTYSPVRTSQEAPRLHKVKSISVTGRGIQCVMFESDAAGWVEQTSVEICLAVTRHLLDNH